ncbi:BnaA09g38490D [Brassica napus]|uniref:BnaA09g38490D protein n=1 Tax=Brassica napus TaxID=3708 RepID=A0A078HU00_BRANA|nr:BnaA09g38490D [Brassica napus]
MFIIVRFKSAMISRNLTTAAKRRRVPSIYKSLAIGEAQKAVTDYLHTTRSLSYSHAEHIAANASSSIRNLILNLDFSVATFSKSIRRHLRYHPINEFEFFFESIGIDLGEVGEYLPEKKFFFSEDPRVLEAACALSGFGFPWNKLGRLYREERCDFLQSGEEIGLVLGRLSGVGFSTVAVAGVCLAFPSVLRGGVEVGCLFVKVRVFYDLGFESEEMWELMGRNRSLFVECSEEDLMRKTDYFCRFGVGKEEAALLILRNPDVMSFDLEKPVISVKGVLKHFGLSEDEVDALSLKHPHVFGRNKMKNLPHVVRALGIHERIFDKLKNGTYHLLSSYSLMELEEDIDREYQRGLEEIQNLRCKTHSFQKLDFLHQIGFAENGLTMKILQHVHGTAVEIQERFQILLDNGIDFSKACMLIRSSPKSLNQKPHSIQEKIRFLCDEMGDSLEYLEVYPAYLCFDLENRISPRFRFHKWLVEKGLSEKNYSIASIVATSEKAFIARLYGIHPAIPKHYFERFSYRKDRSTGFDQMFRQSIAFTPPVHGSDAPPPQQQQSQQQPTVVNVSESSRRQQIAAASSSPVKSHPLHNFPLSDLRWAMNHANTHRLRKPSGRSPLREATNHGKGTEEVNEASGSSSFELRPEKQKKKDVVSDSAADRSGTKSTAADGRSKIFIRIRTKNNEETAEAATTAVSAATVVADVHEADDSAEPVIDADVSIGERISDGGGGGQEGDEFGPKTWNLRPRKPPTKKRSIGGNCGGSGTVLTENKTQGTVRTEAIRSRNGVDAKIATTTERKEKKPRLSISLSKLEIDEDIYSLTGSKPSRRPKKRAKNVQKQLDVLFPGLWMGNVSSDAYKVSEHA